MDPDRVRAYLQISCAGLGFDIGELWWTSNNDRGSTSALAAIEEKKDTTGVSSDSREKKLRFVQLYTSKSYENRRPMLVRPAEEEDEDGTQAKETSSEDSPSDLEKHVLSPTLVDAISKTAQVVWAHTKKTEGLTGRSDIRLQTAVGMPVAVDRDGNMCVVVMFSPNNIQSTDNALEYLQSISRSATSSSIPCLLPAFDPRQGLIPLQHHHHLMNDALPQLSNVLTDGVVTRFVSLDENSHESNAALSIPEVHSDNDLENAPRDCFGIPMLPTIAELGNGKKGVVESDGGNDAFDEASYGVWSTIMQSLDQTDSTLLSEQQATQRALDETDQLVQTSMDDQVFNPKKPIMDIDRQERLEEFASAFLDVSIFDLAEVWVPAGQNSASLCLISSIKTIENNTPLDIFARESKNIPISFWSGAVGRAHSSGNPVWSCNQEVFSDSGRASLFRQTKIETVLAIPVFSGKSKIPAFIFSCYSFVRSGSIPFVLKFVQQALKLLWGGLDNVEPHESVDEDVWKHVAPADLGEMAADVEMHQHFMVKKRPISSISTELDPADESVKALALQVDSLLESSSGPPLAPSIYIGQGEVESPQHQLLQTQTFEGFQSHIHEAIKSVATMQPVHQHIATNLDGSKRAHVFVHVPQSISTQQQQHPTQGNQQEANETNANGFMPAISAPLPLPLPFRLPNQVVQPMNSDGSPVSLHETSTQYQQQTPQQTWHQQTKATATYNQPHGNNSNAHNAQTFVILQQHLQQPEQDIVPTPVYSAPMENVTTKIASTPATGVSQNVQVNEVSKALSPLNTTTAAASRSVTAVITKKAVKPCRIQGCNDPALTRRPYCVRHSGNRMCEHNGCTKCAQGSTRFCIAHGGGRRCTFPGCDKGARDKFFCAAHGGGKRCKHEGCTKSAVGGSNLCTAHGGGRRCSVEGCDKSAQSSTKFCVKHGGGKKCSYAGCSKVSRGRTNFCAAHGGGVRCKLAGCNRVAIGKVQLCRAHGGGARPKGNVAKAYAGSREVRIPMASSIGGMAGALDGTFCVPIIEPVMDATFEANATHTTDLADL